MRSGHLLALLSFVLLASLLLPVPAAEAGPPDGDKGHASSDEASGEQEADGPPDPAHRSSSQADADQAKASSKPAHAGHEGESASQGHGSQAETSQGQTEDSSEDASSAHQAQASGTDKQDSNGPPSNPARSDAARDQGANDQAPPGKAGPATAREDPPRDPEARSSQPQATNGEEHAGTPPSADQSGKHNAPGGGESPGPAHADPPGKDESPQPAPLVSASVDPQPPREPSLEPGPSPLPDETTVQEGAPATEGSAQVSVTSQSGASSWIPILAPFFAGALAGIVVTRRLSDEDDDEAETKRTALPPAGAEGLLVLGREARRRGFYNEAKEWFATATRVRPSLVEAHLELAEANLELKRPEAAIDAAREARNLDPENDEARYLLAQAHASAGDSARAIQELCTLGDGTELIEKARDDPVFHELHDHPMFLDLLGEVDWARATVSP